MHSPFPLLPSPPILMYSLMSSSLFPPLIPYGISPPPPFSSPLICPLLPHLLINTDSFKQSPSAEFTPLMVLISTVLRLCAFFRLTWRAVALKVAAVAEFSSAVQRRINPGYRACGLVTLNSTSAKCWTFRSLCL